MTFGAPWRWLGVVLAVSAVGAAELTIGELRLAGGVRPSEFTFTQDDGQQTQRGSDHYDQAWGIELGLRQGLNGPGRRLGFVLAADLVGQRRTYGDLVQLDGAGLRGGVGIGYALTDAWTALAETGVAGGPSWRAVADSDRTAGYRATGRWMAWDLRLSTTLRLDRRWAVGLTGGYARERWRISGAGITTTQDLSGTWIAAEIIWRWSDLPGGLE